MTATRPDLSRGINVLEFIRTHTQDRINSLDAEIAEKMKGLMQKYVERALYQAQSDMFKYMPSMQDVVPKAAVLHPEEEESDLDIPTFDRSLNGRK